METEEQRRARLERERVAALLTPTDEDIALAARVPVPSFFTPAVDVEIGDARIVEPTAVERVMDAVRADPTQDARQDAERRRRAERAARARRALSDHRARENAYDRSFIEGIEGDIRSFSNEAEAMRAGTLQGMSLGLADEGAGVIGALAGEGYDAARDRARAYDAEARAGAPGYHTAGRVWGGMLPALALPTTTAPTVMGRALESGLGGMGLGAVEGYGTSEEDTLLGQLEDTVSGGAMGFAGGSMGQLVGEGADAARLALRGDPAPTVPPTYAEEPWTPEQRARIRREPGLRSLEDRRRLAEVEAARHRVQSVAPGSTRTDVERALDGMGPDTDEAAINLARRMRESGIVRPDERSMGILPEAAEGPQRRARFLREDAGQRIGATDAEMARRSTFDPDRVRLDDDYVIANSAEDMAQRDAARRAQAQAEARAREEAERTAGSPRRRARQRPADIEPASRMEWEASDGARPTEADALQVRRDIAARRYADDPAEIDALNPARVDLTQTAENLRQQARSLRASLDPRASGQAAELEALAERMDEAGRVPFDAPEGTTSARGVLDRQTENARYGTAAPDANRPYAATQARDIRRDVRQRMDEAIDHTLPPEQAAAHRRDRADYQTATTVEDLRRMGSGRATSNRQVTLSDYTVVANEPTLRGKVAGLLFNRFVRGREHAFMAQLGEARARALATDIARQLQQGGNRQAASRLLALRNRGSQALGVAIREHMESGPEQAAQVADAVARVAPEVAEQDDTLFVGGDAGDESIEIDPDLF